MVYSRDCITSVSLGSSSFYIAQPLHNHHTYWDFTFTFWRMVDVSWSVEKTCGSSFLVNMETTTFTRGTVSCLWLQDMEFFSTGGWCSTVCSTYASLTLLRSRGNSFQSKSKMTKEITAKSEIPVCNQWHASQCNIRFRVWCSACFFPFLCAARHPVDSDERPTAGTRVLAMVLRVPWHPYHSGTALHCRVPSRSERCLPS